MWSTLELVKEPHRQPVGNFSCRWHSCNCNCYELTSNKPWGSAIWLWSTPELIKKPLRQPIGNNHCWWHHNNSGYHEYAHNKLWDSAIWFWSTHELSPHWKWLNVHYSTWQYLFHSFSHGEWAQQWDRNLDLCKSHALGFYWRQQRSDCFELWHWIYIGLGYGLEWLSV